MYRGVCLFINFKIIIIFTSDNIKYSGFNLSLLKLANSKHHHREGLSPGKSDALTATKPG
jgi:hypothetical protein